MVLGGLCLVSGLGWASGAFGQEPRAVGLAPGGVGQGPRAVGLAPGGVGQGPGGIGLAPEAVGQGVAQPAGVTGMPSRRIAFKEESSVGVGALALRLAGGLALMGALAFGAAWAAKRYLPGVRGYSLDGKSRIQLLESRRITPKLTLFVLEFEGRRLLLAQSGERLVELGTRGDEGGLIGDRAKDE